MKGTDVLSNTTIEGLHTLRLQVMAAGVIEQREQPDYAALSFEDRLGLLVDRELLARSNRRLTRMLKTAKLKVPAVIEDIDFRRPRGLERQTVLHLAECHWVNDHQAVLIVGPTGVGKTYLSCALAHSAIRHGHTALYLRAPRMFDELAIARADGRLARLMASWARIDVLWHEAIGDATIADAVLDRLLERANRIELVGESLRRSETTTAAKSRNAK
jgi:DNA replication protein DnaC